MCSVEDITASLQELDKTGAGMIATSTLRCALKRLTLDCASITAPDIDLLLDVADIHCSGVLSYADFVLWIFAPSGAEAEALKRLQAAPIATVDRDRGLARQASDRHGLDESPASADSMDEQHSTPCKGRGKSCGGKGSGKGKISAQKTRAQEPAVIGTKIPVPAEDLHDTTKLWKVAGSLCTLETNEAFTAAFRALGSDSRIPQDWLPATREAFHTFQPWKQRQVLQALAKEPLYNYSFPHRDVQPLLPLDAITWSSVQGVQMSDTGSEGIIFVELEHRRAICVKVPKQPATEIFGNGLCRRLGVRCPELRCLPRDSEEGRIAVEALLAADCKRLPERQRVAATFRKGGPVLLIYEYLEARELADVFPCESFAGTYKQLFGVSPKAADTVLAPALLESSKIMLRACGSIIAFDMVANNHDRLPCIWDNLGNPQNIMLSSDARCPLVAIDNQVGCIPRQNCETRRGYLEKVRQITRAVVRAPDVEHAAFAEVRRFFSHGCKQDTSTLLVGCGWEGLRIDVGEEGTLEVQRGFLATIRRTAQGVGPAGAACARGFVTREVLEKEEKAVRALFGTGNVAESYGFERIDLDFCMSVIDIFREELLSLNHSG
mmetsp:Transcript_78963/g.156403  ORF Transcript_78963/g.156403 Transcript_78963/m.156403 type:complete len:608 (-) Transcript_78963:86-1909(-)